MIPSHLLSQMVTVVTGATVTDSRGDERLEFDPTQLDDPDLVTTVDIAASLQQIPRFSTEVETTSGDRAAGRWQMMHNAEVNARQRIIFGDLVFLVDGHPTPVFTPAGLHHYETNLQLVEG